MKRANGQGTITFLRGNRRKPYYARITTGYEVDEENLKVTQKFHNLGTYATREEAEKAITHYLQKSEIHKSYVYFITDGRYIKIGKANDVNKRIMQLQTSCADTLSIIKTLQFEDETSAFEVEKYFHTVFEDRRKLNEWFDISIDDVFHAVGRWV